MTINQKFSYLRQYVDQKKYIIDTRFENSLWSLEDCNEIAISEQRLGFEFPSPLKEFWIEIGYGRLSIPHNASKGYESDHNNHIFRPKDIADIILLKEESGLILPEVTENHYFAEEDIPFFEVADMTLFLVMKRNSKLPNAVYNILGEIIEEDFEKFIWRLYYESPTYYLHINK